MTPGFSEDMWHHESYQFFSQRADHLLKTQSPRAVSEVIVDGHFNSLPVSVWAHIDEHAHLPP